MTLSLAESAYGFLRSGYSLMVAVREVGEYTFRLVQRYVDSIVTVSTDEICAAIKDVFEDTRSILEPAGALAVAGLKQMSLGVACGQEKGCLRSQHEL